MSTGNGLSFTESAERGCPRGRGRVPVALGGFEPADLAVSNRVGSDAHPNAHPSMRTLPEKVRTPEINALVAEVLDRIFSMPRGWGHGRWVHTSLWTSADGLTWPRALNTSANLAEVSCGSTFLRRRLFRRRGLSVRSWRGVMAGHGVGASHEVVSGCGPAVVG
jgi:hypothetical protein